MGSYKEQPDLRFDTGLREYYTKQKIQFQKNIVARMLFIIFSMVYIVYLSFSYQRENQITRDLVSTSSSIRQNTALGQQLIADNLESANGAINPMTELTVLHTQFDTQEQEDLVQSYHQISSESNIDDIEQAKDDTPIGHKERIEELKFAWTADRSIHFTELKQWVHRIITRTAVAPSYRRVTQANTVNANDDLIWAVEQLEQSRLGQHTDKYDLLLVLLLERGYFDEHILLNLAQRLKTLGQIDDYHRLQYFLINDHQRYDQAISYLQELLADKQFSMIELFVESLAEEQQKVQQTQEIYGASLIESEKWTKATHVYQLLTRRWPYQPAYWCALGRALEQASDHQQALEAYQQTLNLGPELPIKKLAIAGVLRLSAHEYNQHSSKSDRRVSLKGGSD